MPRPPGIGTYIAPQNSGLELRADTPRRREVAECPASSGDQVENEVDQIDPRQAADLLDVEPPGVVRRPVGELGPEFPAQLNSLVDDPDDMPGL